MRCQLIPAPTTDGCRVRRAVHPRDDGATITLPLRHKADRRDR
jgi:hypothetical protein